MKRTDPKPILASTLNIEKTPIPKRKRKPKTTGKRYHNGIRGFLYSLFKLNEELPKSKKLTDGEIVRQVLIEFSHVPKIYRFWKQNAFKAAYHHRSEYNRGRLVPHLGPPKTPDEVSVSYDTEGFVVNLRFTKPKRLSQSEVKALKQRIFDKYSVPWFEHQKQVQESLSE